MAFQVEALHLLVTHFDFGFVLLPVEAGFDLQAGLRLRSSNTGQQQRQAALRLAGPIDADRPKQPMLDRVVVRSPRRVMTNGHGQAKTIGHLGLQPCLPQPRPATIAAATIRDERGGVARRPEVLAGGVGLTKRA